MSAQRKQSAVLRLLRAEDLERFDVGAVVNVLYPDPVAGVPGSHFALPVAPGGLNPAEFLSFRRF
jgi:hypothetical protein